MNTTKITIVDAPGSSGLTPTGPLQFQDDWPGVWLRGDDCMMLAMEIRMLEPHLLPSSMLRKMLEMIETAMTP